MLEPDCCVEVRRRLAEHGLPAARIERIVEELAEHWEDLRAAALEEGQTESAAVNFATARLGRPEQLAHDVIEGLRQSTLIVVLHICVATAFLWAERRGWRKAGLALQNIHSSPI